MEATDSVSSATSLKIINTYVIPILLYGLEAVNLSAAQLDEIASFHKDLLRRIQRIPRYTASEAIYLLIGTRDGGLEDRPRSRPNFNGLGLRLGLGCPCLGIGLGGPGFVYRVSRTGLGLEAGLET